VHGTSLLRSAAVLALSSATALVVTLGTPIPNPAVASASSSVHNITTTTVPALSGRPLGVVLHGDGTAFLPVAAEAKIDQLSPSRQTVSTITIPSAFPEWANTRVASLSDRVVFVGQPPGLLPTLFAYDVSTGQVAPFGVQSNWYDTVGLDHDRIYAVGVDPCGNGGAVYVYSNAVSISDITWQKLFARANCDNTPPGVERIPLDAYGVSDLKVSNGLVYVVRELGGFYQLDPVNDTVTIYDSSNVAGPGGWSNDPHSILPSGDGHTFFLSTSTATYLVDTETMTSSSFTSDALHLWQMSSQFLLASHYFDQYPCCQRIWTDAIAIDVSDGSRQTYSSSSAPPLLPGHIAGVSGRSATGDLYVATEGGLSVVLGACEVPPPAWRLPWEYGTSWYFNGGPHDWSTAAPGTCVDPPDNCSGTASGIDFGRTADDSVYAMADGIVYFAGEETYGTCGAANVVKIRHSGGWETWYLHLATFAPGIEGATNVYVQQGRFLGRAGATGLCSGAVHLHIELCGGLPDGAYCPSATQHYHHSWDGQVVDDWTIHADCSGSTDPNCSATNYDNYMSKGSTQVLPCGDNTCTRKKVGPSQNPTYVPLLWEPFSLEQGGTSVFVISLATGQQRMYVSWQWDGSTVDGWLTAPDSTVIDSSTIDPNVVYRSDATSAYYEITNPQAGEWTLHSFGADVPDGPEVVLVAAGSISAPVGGIAELPDIRAPADAGAPPGDSSWPPAKRTGLVAGLAAALLAATTGAWYARRRRRKA